MIIKSSKHVRLSIPEPFDKALETDAKLRAAVYGTAADFEPWLADSKLFFFPDYTDHGIEHVNQVLATAAALATTDAHQLLTAGDMAILIIATLLHDSAMHLSGAGFESLITGAANAQRISDFDREGWPALWESFLFSAKRWDDVRLTNVFGELEEGSPR